jgi:hypothetical protein
MLRTAGKLVKAQKMARLLLLAKMCAADSPGQKVN